MSSHQPEDIPPLMGRENELARIDEAVSLLRTGVGGVVVVEGSAGTGRSSILAAAHARSSDLGIRVLSARARLGDSLTPGSTAKRWWSAGDSVAPEQVCSTLVAEARRQATVLLLDDAHWADEMSAECLVGLASAGTTAPVLLIVSIRREAIGGPHRLLSLAVATATHGDWMQLQPFDLKATQQLVDATCPAGFAESAAALHARTRGNPQLLTALLRSDPSPTTAGIPNGAAPATTVSDEVRQVARSRLAELPPDAVLVAIAVAVLGLGADGASIAALTGLSPARSGELRDGLLAVGVLADDAAWQLAAPAIADAILSDVAPARLSDLRHRAARLVWDRPDFADVAADQLLLAEPANDPWAAEVLLAAANRALRAGQPDRAARLLRRCLHEPPRTSDRAAAFALFAESEIRCNRMQPAAEALTVAIDHAESPVAAAWLCRKLAFCLTRLGRSIEAAAAVQRALEDLDARDRDAGLALEAELLVLSRLDRLVAASLANRTPRFAVSAARPTTHGERLALAAMANGEMNAGKATAAIRLGRLAWDGGAMLDGEGPQTLFFYLLAITLLYSDDLIFARDIYTTAIERARAMGATSPARSALAFRSGAHLRLGDLTAAARDCDAATENGFADLRPSAIFAVGFHVETLVEMGDLAKAEAVLAAAGMSQNLPDDLTSNLAQHARGRLHLARGRVAEALSDFENCRRRADYWGMTTPAVANWASSAALARSVAGDPDLARRDAATGVTMARRFGSPRCIGMALTVAGQVNHDPDVLSKAVTVLDTSAARLEQARARIKLGRVLRLRDSAKARDVLQEGLRLARRCYSVQLATEAHDELAALGVKSRRIVTAGVGSLTRNELRVVELAARGETNRSIAEALYLSRRTVESHLAHAFRKLNITSRSELPRVLSG